MQNMVNVATRAVFYKCSNLKFIFITYNIISKEALIQFFGTYNFTRTMLRVQADVNKNAVNCITGIYWLGTFQAYK